MTGAIIILCVTALVGLISYLYELRWRKKAPSQLNSVSPDDSPSTDDSPSSLPSTPSTDDSPSTDDEECCGLHLVCEKDSLSPMSAEIEYYDDEELDRFADRDPSTYTPEEEEEIREVFNTLLESDILGWARSLTQRHIALPADVRDSLLMLARDLRQKNTQ